MLYGYGMRLGADLLRDGRYKRGLRYIAAPVNYWRRVEYRFVWERGAFTADDRVLDIGSPKLLAIYLAEKVGAEVYATDVDGYFEEEFTYLRAARRLSPRRLHIQVEDGRSTSFPDQHFTKAFAISVLEHIPDDGDAACAREVGRLLRPGGRFLLTVPFWPESRMVYRRPDFYWADVPGAGATDEPVFFQRRYSEADLFERLVEPSGLRVARLEYFGERVMAHSKREVVDLLPLPTSPIQPLLSRLFLKGPVGDWRSLEKPLCAAMVLEKR